MDIFVSCLIGKLHVESLIGDEFVRGNSQHCMYSIFKLVCIGKKNIKRKKEEAYVRKYSTCVVRELYGLNFNGFLVAFIVVIAKLLFDFEDLILLLAYLSNG